MSSRRVRTRALGGRWGAALEGLEARQLLTGYINTIATLSAPAPVGPMVAARDGSLWFWDEGNALTKLSISGAKSTVALPSAPLAGSSVPVSALVVDPANDVWYARGTTVGKVTPTGQLSWYTIPGAGATAGEAAVGPDGNVYVALTTPQGPALAKVAPSGGMTVAPLAGVTRVQGMALGSDGNLWFVDGNRIAKTTSDGQVTHYPVPAPADGAPVDLSQAKLTLASDGNLWFVGLGGVSRITPSGAVTTFQAPGTHIDSLTAGADGNLWLTFVPSADAHNNLSATPGAVVARMTTDGVTTVVPERAGTDATPVVQMAAGQGTGIWLDEGGHVLARLNVMSVPTVSAPAITPTTAAGVKTDAAGVFQGAIVSFAPNTPDTGASSYSATIDWGDGSPAVAGQVAANAKGGFDVTGTHTYALPADTSRNVTVRVADANNSVATIFNTVTVKPTPVMPVVTPGTTPAQAIAATVRAGGTNAQAVAAGMRALAVGASQSATAAAGTTPTAATSPASRHAALLAARRAYALTHRHVRAHPAGPHAARARHR